MTRIKISGYKYYESIQKAFDSRMVDIAYIDEIGDGEIYIVPDDQGFDFDDKKEIVWLISIIKSVLNDVGENGVCVSVC